MYLHVCRELDHLVECLVTDVTSECGDWRQHRGLWLRAVLRLHVAHEVLLLAEGLQARRHLAVEHVGKVGRVQSDGGVGSVLVVEQRLWEKSIEFGWTFKKISFQLFTC